MKSAHIVAGLILTMVVVAFAHLSLAADPNAEPGLLYVDDNASDDPAPFDANSSDPNEDGSWDHPFDSIQEAIDCAGTGSTILIHPGRYYENLLMDTKMLRLVGMVTDEPSLAIIDGLHHGPVVSIAQVTDPNCLILGLTLTQGQGVLGGAVECWQSQVRMINCLITGNQATDPNGAAIFCAGSVLMMDHCTVADNIGGVQGAALMFNHSPGTVSNSIVWGNTPVAVKTQEPNLLSITYSDLAEGWPGPGNIDEDPQFVQPEQTWGYPLQSTSPCIDQGDPNTVLSSAFLDLNGDVRILNGRVDIGADEFDPLSGLLPSDEPIVIPDAGLKAAVETELGQADPTAADMLGLIHLNASIRSIVDLTGLEYARNLQTLNLQGNHELKDLTPLAGLTQLRTLDLSSNQIEDVSALAGMIHLEFLDLHDNLIDSIAPLMNLTELHTGFLHGNELHDISVLARMPQMEILQLSDNMISDVSPLTNLMSLRQLDLLQNPLNQAACDTDIPLIMANNPSIDITFRPCDPFRLTLSSTAGGKISTPGEGVFSYDYGTTVTIKAESNPGYRFVNFTGSLISNQNVISLTLKSDYILQAHFEAMDNVVSIPDNGLRDAVETTLGKANPTPDDMLALTDLDASHRLIRSLTGLEYATNLQWLDVQRNRNINNLTPLTGLVQLQYLDLNNNHIRDLSPLADMIHLEYLDIHDNVIDSITPLAGLTQLRTAILYRNSYSDISSLSGMTQVETLLIYDNLISDISPLAHLTSLRELNMTRNPLNDEACNVYIPQIVNNNPDIKIFYHCGPIRLDLSSTAGGHISSPGEGAYFYDFGSSVMIQAQPDAGYRFVSFSGNQYFTQNPVIITLKIDTTIQANFEPIE